MNTAALIAAASILLSACAATAAPAPVAPPQAFDPMIRDGVLSARLSIPDSGQPAIEAGVWLPTEAAAEPRPLIVISHGNGGDFRSHHDTAAALAKAGFVVAALTHTGDNWRDQSRATDIVGRTRQLSVLSLAGRRSRGSADSAWGLSAVASRGRVAHIMPAVARALITRPWPYHSSQPTSPTTGHNRTASVRLSTTGKRVRTATAGGVQIQAEIRRLDAQRAKIGKLTPKASHPAHRQTTQ